MIGSETLDKQVSQTEPQLYISIVDELDYVSGFQVHEPEFCRTVVDYMPTTMCTLVYFIPDFHVTIVFGQVLCNSGLDDLFQLEYSQLQSNSYLCDNSMNY